MPITYKPSGAHDRDPAIERSWSEAMRRGARLRCPSCGHGSLFSSFLKVNAHCPTCNEALHHHQADDAPAYFTIFIVGHIIVAAMLHLEQAYAPPIWLHMALWVPAAIIGSAFALPRIKGALIGLQWAHRMHGFSEDAEETLAQGIDPQVR